MAVNTRLLCSVSICLLGAGLLDAGVIQTPTHLIMEKGQNAVFRCNPIKGHSYVFWYRQFLGEDLKFLIYFQNDQKVDESGMPKSRFLAKHVEDLIFKIEIQPTELVDSAVYFCASSESTVKQKHLLPELKPPMVPHRKHQGWEKKTEGNSGTGCRDQPQAVWYLGRVRVGRGPTIQHIVILNSIFLVWTHDFVGIGNFQ
uniref:Immunoglobulin V-set domain-containing protein n=2 Tax=Vombatus ursinus TaxID=29139 RepID=A0A4X2L526_VOMUR